MFWCLLLFSGANCFYSVHWNIYLICSIEPSILQFSTGIQTIIVVYFVFGNAYKINELRKFPAILTVQVEWHSMKCAYLSVFQQSVSTHKQLWITRPSSYFFFLNSCSHFHHAICLILASKNTNRIWVKLTLFLSIYIYSWIINRKQTHTTVIENYSSFRVPTFLGFECSSVRQSVRLFIQGKWI